ncbi:MAG: YchJ family metal-binding protein [Chlamydiales bacterium]|nr:YchJ family metal-binding protein [Chlamydiales bacterium]
MSGRLSSTICPCGSGKLYDTCCRPFHEGLRPSTALELMRSRYSAYVKHLATYIIDTTHPSNPSAMADLFAWTGEILAFTKSTHFERLEILQFTDGDKVAYVRFKAYMRQGGSDITFIEMSRFEKISGRWLYRDGKIFPG